MPPRFRLVVALSLTAVLAAGPSGLPADESAISDRPNIIVILADDMGYSDIGPTGSEIATPNLDRLAAEGQLWPQFYNNAKCTTTRVSLLTGCYPLPREPHFAASTPTVAETLRRVGYRTIHVGKWHLGAQSAYIGSVAPYRPSDRGFDTHYGLLDGCCNYFDPGQRDPAFKKHKLRHFARDDRRIREFPSDFYTTDAFTEEACRQIVAGEKDPFFLHLCYTAPHYPLHAKPDDIARYRGRYRDGWDALRRQRFERQAELGLVEPDWPLPPPEDDVPEWETLPESQQDYYDHLMATYAAMVTAMDRGIGRVLQTLDEQGLTDNTLIVFLSDNGGCSETLGGIRFDQTPGVASTYTTVGPGWAYAQNTPYRRFKQWIHEGGVRTPAIVRWPGQIPAGSRCDGVGHLIDLHPTFAEAAATEPLAASASDAAGDAVDGISLLNSMRTGEPQPRPEPLFWLWSRRRGVRDGNLKAVYRRDADEWRLFDLALDPTEAVDLSSEHPAELDRLIDAWDQWHAGQKRIAAAAD